MNYYKDAFANINFDENNGILTLLWLKETSNMQASDFQRVLEKFADLSLEHKISKLMVNVEKFGFSDAMGPELAKWRANTIVPKYNQAGVQKFAFVHGANFEEPEGSGKPIEGEIFTTRNFGAESIAIGWLIEGHKD